MNQEEILKRLYELQDFGYQKFHSKLMPGIDNIIGVRLPDLRKLSAEIIRDDPMNYLDTFTNEWYEQCMLYGMVLTGAKFDIETTLLKFDEFLPFINNWAVCDCTTNRMKIIEKNRKRSLDWILSHLESDKPYTLRVCICLLMMYFINDEYIDTVLEIFSKVTNDHYYVKMALSWALCECLIKYYDKTIKLIESKSLAPWVQNKSIQKSIESFRLTADQKLYLKSLKINQKKIK